MIIIYNSKIAKLLKVNAFTWGKKVFVNGATISPKTKRHEAIHIAQYAELGKFMFMFYYLLDWIKKFSYRRIRLEQEAYKYDSVIFKDYLKTRVKFAWKKFKV